MSRLCHALTLEEMCTCYTQHQYYRPACEWIDGTVVDLQPGVVTFNFQKTNKPVNIHKHTFTNYSKQESKNMGTRIQFPLEFAFGLTVHKAQGLALNRVCIDCRNMTNSGQIGVSVGRAKAKRVLRIINVNKYLLRPHPQSVCYYYQGLSAPLKEDCT